LTAFFLIKKPDNQGQVTDTTYTSITF